MSAPRAARAVVLRILSDVWAGFSTPSTASWMGAVVVCALEFVACAVYFDEGRLARMDPRWLMSTSRDEYMLLTTKLLRLRSAELKGHHVAYMGASQSLRSLRFLDEERLGEELTRAAGLPAAFHVLGGNDERFEDVLGITDQLPSSFRGVVVLVVTDYKDDYRSRKKDVLKRKRQRIAFATAPSLLPIWKQSGYRPPASGNFFLDHLAFFSARREVALRLRPVDGAYVGTGRVNLARRAKDEAALASDREALEEEGENGAKRRSAARAPLLAKSRHVLETLLDNMEERGIEVMFVEAPQLPLRAEVYAERIARYQAEMAEISTVRGLRYVDFNAELALQDADFQDKLHLATPEKRRQFQDLLMAELGVALRELAADADEAGQP